MSLEKIETQIVQTRDKLKKLEAKAKEMRRDREFANVEKLAKAASAAGIDIGALTEAQIANFFTSKPGGNE